MPSGPTAGGELRPGRCEPHMTLSGTAVGLGGHGSWPLPKMPRHMALEAGRPGVIEAQVAAVGMPFAATLTSQALTFCELHESVPCGSWMVL